MGKSVFLMGMNWISIGRVIRDGNRVGDDPKSSKSINANDDAFDFAALSFTGNTVGGRVALAA